jgi:hypothetical protein
MKHLAIWFLTLATAWLPGIVNAGSVTLEADKELCDSSPSMERAAILEPSRNGSIITLVVTAQLNCAHVPDKPELREWRNAATLSLPTSSPSGMATACLCARRMTFEISDLYDGVETIYYVQDGTALGHVDAP